MEAYSIDLGLDMAATRGALGTLSQPFPLQIGICSGTLDSDGSFKPAAVASFRGLQSRQTLILRTFDISPGDNPDRQLEAPLFVRTSFRDLLGNAVPDPWAASGSASLTVAEPEICLSFASTKQTSFPCYRQLDANLEPVTYLLLDVSEEKTYLLSVLVAAYVIEGKVYQTRYYGSDPEMVVGPYDGGNRRLPARVAG